jgi:hypothetical protein
MVSGGKGLSRTPMRVTLACVAVASLAAAGEPARAWRRPVEVLAGKGDREFIPVAVARGESGATGVFVLEKDVGLALHVSKNGRTPWKALFLPHGLVGDVRISGDVAETVMTDFDARNAWFAKFDLAQARELSRVEIPGKLGRSPLLSTLHSDGDARVAVLFCEASPLFCASSADGGKTWSPWAEIGRPARGDESVAPPLFADGAALRTVFVAEGGAVARLATADRGATWTREEGAFEFGKEDGLPILCAGAADGRARHLVFFTSAERYVHFHSADAGRTWRNGRVAAACRGGDLACIFRVRAAAGRVALAFTETDAGKRFPKIARMVTSLDAGKTWEEEALAAGVTADTGLPCFDMDASGSVLAVFLRQPEFGKAGGKYVLLREFGEKREEGKEEAAEWWGGK